MANTFSHLNEDRNPSMVDISDKKISTRSATAVSKVILSREIIDLLQKNESINDKGPVFQTAIIAGIMAAKKTSELIPLCHNIPIDGCDISIRMQGMQEIEILCSVKTSHKTGVEMEALTGASVAALCIYDMCKSFSHNIRIKETRLLEKKGGKSNFSNA